MTRSVGEFQQLASPETRIETENAESSIDYGSPNKMNIGLGHPEEARLYLLYRSGYQPRNGMEGI